MMSKGCDYVVYGAIDEKSEKYYTYLNANSQRKIKNFVGKFI